MEDRTWEYYGKVEVEVTEEEVRDAWSEHHDDYGHKPSDWDEDDPEIVMQFEELAARMKLHRHVESDDISTLLESRGRKKEGDNEF